METAISVGLSLHPRLSRLGGVRFDCGLAPHIYKLVSTPFLRLGTVLVIRLSPLARKYLPHTLYL